MILGLTLIAIGVFLMTLSIWYKPSLHVDSWGKPESDDICGYSVLFCLAFLFGGLIFFIGIDALGGGY